MEPIFEKDSVIINGLYYRFVSLYDFPTNMDFNSLTFVDDYFLNFQKLPVEVAKAKALKASRKHSANIESKNTKQIESEKATDETEAIYSKLIDGETSLFKTQMWFVVKAFDRETLNYKTNELVDYLQRIEALPLIETHALKPILKSFIPSNSINFTRSFETPSEYLACMLPYTGDHLHKQGVGFSSINSNKLNIDIFNQELSNYNVFITGKSGSGKSMAGQKLVEGLIAGDGVKAVILDKGYSFLKITKFFDGNEFSEKFNPLQFCDVTYLKEFVISVTTQEGMTKKKQGEIYESIENFLASKKKRIFSSFLTHLEESIPEIRHYFAEIIPFITDEPIEVKPITYVDTTKYPKSIIPALIIYLIEYFKNIDGKKIFVFDECWEYLKNNQEYIEECYRTFRKFNGSAIAITQGITDFLNQNGGVGEIIFNNTCHKFYFKQDRVPEKLIHSEDIEIITSLETVQGQYSEFLYKDEFLRKTCRYFPTQLEYELFTSKKDENNLIYKFIANLEGSIGFKSSIEKWVNIKYN